MTIVIETQSDSSITFLFTDIEGNAELWEQHPEAMKVAVERYNAILHQAVESHHGDIFKMAGDATFYTAFTSAPQAVLAALDAQRALHTEAPETAKGGPVIRVRMALHTGAERRDGDYFGQTFNRTARLLSSGHGGQTLLSAATQALVLAHLPQGVTLRDMGERSIKGLAQPERTYQLLSPDLPADFPPLKTLETFRTNLPVPPTSFIGREQEIAAIKRLMAAHRLTILVGTGGSGKTRLSLQVAADLLDSFPDGIWFVELAPLADPALVPQTVANTLGLHEDASRPILDTLTTYLRPKTTLLILDNCEHVIGAAAELAGSLLQACPNLSLLVSSRQAFDISGESIFHVPALSIPDPNIAYAVTALMDFESVRLFLDRAQTVAPGFALNNDNARFIAQICARLDGIPLAIELVAAHVKMLGMEQITEHLTDLFKLLTDESRGALPRQQTLRAMINWSYDLLPEPDRALLRQMSVFAGGCTLDAAEAVCVPLGTKGGDVLELLSQLANKSLVVIDDGAGEARYRLLENVLHYAREKLFETGEYSAARERHLKYFLGLAERAELELVRPHVVEWIQRLEIELDNIRAALKWSLTSQAPELGLRLANALLWFWAEGGYVRDGYDWLTELLNHPQAQSHTRARARALGVMGFFLALGDFGKDARPILEESLALYRELGDKSGIAHGLLYEGIFIFREHNAKQGTKLILESLEIYRELEHKLGIFAALAYLGSIIYENDYPRARADLVEALEICYEIEYLSGIARSLSSLGHLALRHGDYPAAHRWLEEALTTQRQLGKGRYAIYTLSHLGELTSREGDYTQAQTYYKECLALIDQTGGLSTMAGWILVKFGHAAIWQGNVVSARNFLEQSLQHFTRTNEKIGIIFTVEGFARLALLQEQPEQAACLLAWADAIRETIDNPRPLIEQADVDRDLAKIRALLAPVAFEEAQAKGRAMTMEHGMAYALQAW
jgi:predicted ATPase/class 3 adenylate cyclase/tetratricopeptide (TPR) repeat protein